MLEDKIKKKIDFFLKGPLKKKNVFHYSFVNLVKKPSS